MANRGGTKHSTTLPDRAFEDKMGLDKDCVMRPMKKCVFCGKLISYDEKNIGNLTAHFKRCRGNSETGFQKLTEVDPRETLVWYQRKYFDRENDLMEPIIRDHFQPLWAEIERRATTTRVRFNDDNLAELIDEEDVGEDPEETEEDEIREDETTENTDEQLENQHPIQASVNPLEEEVRSLKKYVEQTNESTSRKMKRLEAIIEYQEEAQKRSCLFFSMEIECMADRISKMEQQHADQLKRLAICSAPDSGLQSEDSGPDTVPSTREGSLDPM